MPSIWVNDTAPSVDLQIFDADVIVVASLDSATGGVQQLGEIHRPRQILHFRSSEYLKGTGPEEFVVEVPIVELQTSTSAKALELAQVYISLRNTRYDGRLVILFLRGPLPAPAIYEGQSDIGRIRSDSSPASVFNFALEEFLAIRSWRYSINSIAKVRLPARNEPSSNSRTRAPQNWNPEFITDGKVIPPTVLRLSQLRNKISALSIQLATGAGIPGFNACVRNSLDRERFYSNWVVSTVPHTIASGAHSYSQVLHDRPVGYGDSAYRVVHVSGKGAFHFRVVLVDDDDDPAKYSFKYTPTRPLPASVYKVGFMGQLPDEIPCGFVPNPIDFLGVTAESPAGTLHEAFFDPVTVGTAVVPDDTVGKLEPTSFTVGSTSTEFSILQRTNNQVVHTLGNHISLSGQVLDFIALDGSVILSLLAHEAAADTTAGSYTWSMSSQPWVDRDMFMLQIRSSGGSHGESRS